MAEEGEATAKLSKHVSADLSASVFLIASDGRMLNLPIPSKSTRDPLNWSPQKRAKALFCLLLFSIIGLTTVLAPSLLYQQLVLEFANQRTQPFTLGVLLLSPTLFMGIGVFIWAPLSLAIGRRPVLLLAHLVLLGATIWAGFTRTFYELLVAVCLQGLAEGASSSAVFLMAIDLTYIHERPQTIAILWSMAGAIGFTTLSVVPQMNLEQKSWRIFYEIWGVLILLSFVLAFLCFPETYFLRPAVAFDGRVLLQSATEKVEIYPEWRSSLALKELPDVPSGKWRLKLSELKIWRSHDGGWRAMGSCYLQIFFCILNPQVCWVLLLFTLGFASTASTSATYATVLSSAPYNKSIAQTALVNVAGAAGSVLALPASSYLIRWITSRLTIRNGGVRNGEFFLPAFILPCLTLAASLILFGVVAERKLHFVLIHVSYLLNCLGFISLATAITVWVTEALPRNAAAALTTVLGGGYMLSFGYSFLIKPWIRDQGLTGADIELALILLFVSCVGVPFVFWGQKVRQTVQGRWAKHEGGALRPQSGRQANDFV